MKNKNTTAQFENSKAKARFMDYYQNLMPINQDKFGQMIRDLYWKKMDDENSKEFKVTEKDVVKVYKELMDEI